MSKIFTSKPIKFVHPVLAKLNLEDHHQAFGLLAASPGTDFRETVKTIAAHVPVPQVGGVSPGNPFDASGDPFGTLIAFLGKKGVRRAVVHSEPLTRDNCAEIMGDLRARCAENLGGAPKLYLAFLPANAGAFPEEASEALFGMADGVPVFGGVLAAPGSGAAGSAVFAAGECFPDRVALVALAGDVCPVFAAGSGELGESTNACLAALKEGMAERIRESYRFDIIMAFSHETRFRAREADNYAEADAMKAELPEEIRQFGLFTAAEFCPVADGDGRLNNARHGEALVLCAF